MTRLIRGLQAPNVLILSTNYGAGRPHNESYNRAGRPYYVRA